MSILLKFIIKNIIEKKFRTFLVILSIAITSALFFASIAVSDTLLKMDTERLRQMSGTSDIIIQPKNDSASTQFLSMEEAKKVSNSIDYAVGVLNGSALYAPDANNRIYFGVLGITLNDLELLNPVSLYEESSLEPFKGNKILISKRSSEKYNIQVGSRIELEISSAKRRFTVAGICNPEGFFVDESRGLFMIMPKDTLSEIYNSGNGVNTIYIKLRNQVLKQDVMNQFDGIYKNGEVRESIDRLDLMQNVNRFSAPFKLVVILVILMSAFIIYTSFKVISLERLPLIGTFRSIGATKMHTNFVLIFETVVLGIVGGIVGCGLGIVVLYYMTAIFTADYSSGVGTQITFSLIQLVITFVFAIVLCLGSSLIPILSVIRMTVKDIILRLSSKVAKRRNRVILLAVILLIISLVVPVFVEGFIMTMIIVSTCMTFALLAVVLLIPPLTGVLTNILAGVYERVFGNEGTIAARNVSGNKSLLNNITLLAVAISGILLIYTIDVSLSEQIERTFADMCKYDIMMSYRQGDDSLIRQLSRVDGVESATGIYVSSRVSIEEKPGLRIGMVYGVDKDDYFDYLGATMFDDCNDAVKALDSDRNIIMTDLFRDKLGFKKGDSITLSFDNRKKTYTITGFLSTKLASGNVAFISDKYAKRDADFKYFSSIFIKTSYSPDEVKSTLKRKYLKNILNIQSLEEMIQNNKEGAEGIFVILKGFSQIAMLIGIIGIINNLIVSFIERKRYFAMFRSQGMSKKQLRKMLFTEAITIGILGLVFAFIACLIFMRIIPFLLKPIVGLIQMRLSGSLVVTTTVSVLIMMFVTSIIPAMKSSRMSIIESLKYE